MYVSGSILPQRGEDYYYGLIVEFIAYCYCNLIAHHLYHLKEAAVVS